MGWENLRIQTGLRCSPWGEKESIDKAHIMLTIYYDAPNHGGHNNIGIYMLASTRQLPNTALNLWLTYSEEIEMRAGGGRRSILEVRKAFPALNWVLC